jgi:hypothetical protein
VRVNFVTVCSRPENLSVISTRISEAPKDWDVRWYLGFDGHKVSQVPELRKSFPNVVTTMIPEVLRGAGEARNVLFRQIDDGYVHVLDDDNILPDHFWNLMKDVLAQGYTEHVIVGHQVLKNGVIRLIGSRENMRKCAVDSASIVWHRKLQGDVMWDDTYECDGSFVEELVKRHADKFVYTGAVISYYNFLQ